jgi:hypothetical protein
MMPPIIREHAQASSREAHATETSSRRVPGRRPSEARGGSPEAEIRALTPSALPRGRAGHCGSGIWNTSHAGVWLFSSGGCVVTYTAG